MWISSIEKLKISVTARQWKLIIVRSFWNSKVKIILKQDCITQWEHVKDQKGKNDRVGTPNEKKW